MWCREVGTQDCAHCSIVVLATATVTQKAAYNATWRHGRLMTASRVKDGTEGKGCLDPVIPLLLSSGLQQCARCSSRVRG